MPEPRASGQAQEARRRGDRERARRELERILTHYGEMPIGERARALLDELDPDRG